MTAKPGAQRTPCPRTLVARGPNTVVETSACGIREVHVGNTTIHLDDRGFRDFCETLLAASLRLAAPRSEPSAPGAILGFGSVPRGEN